MVIYTRGVQKGRSKNDQDSYRESPAPACYELHDVLMCRVPTETNTQMTWFAILEGGLSVVCVNLPSLWYFVTLDTSKRALGNIGSFLTFRSFRHDRQSPKEASKQSSRLNDKDYHSETTV